MNSFGTFFFTVNLSCALLLQVDNIDIRIIGQWSNPLKKREKTSERPKVLIDYLKLGLCKKRVRVRERTEPKGRACSFFAAKLRNLQMLRALFGHQSAEDWGR